MPIGRAGSVATAAQKVAMPSRTSFSVTGWIFGKHAEHSVEILTVLDEQNVSMTWSRPSLNPHHLTFGGPALRITRSSARTTCGRQSAAERWNFSEPNAASV